jgi:hypothetical protein
MKAAMPPIAAEPGARRAYSVVFFVALLSTAIALGGALAHLLELPNKIDLPRDQYFIVQRIYRGWALLGIVLLVQLLSIIGVIARSKRQPPVRRAAVLALVALIAAQGLFWIYTYPANVATDNWTTQPENWQSLRRQWEYSHALGAVCQLLAMSALAVGALARRR